MGLIVIFFITIGLFIWLCCSSTNQDVVNKKNETELENYVINIDDATKKEILSKEIKRIEDEMNDEEYLKYSIAVQNGLYIISQIYINESLELITPYGEKTNFEKYVEELFIKNELGIGKEDYFFKVDLKKYKILQEYREIFEKIYPLEKEKLINEYKKELEKLKDKINEINIIEELCY